MNVGVATAAGADGIDGACVAAVAPRNTSDPGAAAGEPATGWAGVAAAVDVEAIVPNDVDVAAGAAGGTGRLIAGCGATAPNVPNAVPADGVAVLADSVDAGTEEGAATGADAKVTGVAAAGAGVADVCRVEPNVGPDALLVGGVTAGASVDAGVEARGSEP